MAICDDAARLLRGSSAAALRKISIANLERNSLQSAALALISGRWFSAWDGLRGTDTIHPLIVLSVALVPDRSPSGTRL